MALVTWYRKNRRDLPWRRSSDPYAIWVAEIMLQQTTVQAVIPYYRRFLRRFPDLASLARARPSAVLAAWSGLGYYRRARNLHAAARRIRDPYGGLFPTRFEDVLALPGVGRYTAGAITSIAFRQRRPVLDGNVARVLARLLCLRGDPRSAPHTRRLWSAAAALVEASTAPGDLNQALMELGATICTPASPDCPRCPIAASCGALRSGKQHDIPPPRRRRTPVRMSVQLALIERDGRILMRRRAATGLMDGLWDLPTLGRSSLPSGRRGPGGALRLRKLGPLASFRHTITYRQLQVEVVGARLLAEPRGSGYRWVSPARARELPISSLVSKALDRLQ
jgi:A/G-specific adenine glycosylase